MNIMFSECIHGKIRLTKRLDGNSAIISGDSGTMELKIGDDIVVVSAINKMVSTGKVDKFLDNAIVTDGDTLYPMLGQLLIGRI